MNVSPDEYPYPCQQECHFKLVIELIEKDLFISSHKIVFPSCEGGHEHSDHVV